MTKKQSELFQTSTSSAVESPVSRSVSRVEKKERKTTDTSGRTCLKLLNRKNPLMQLSKTLVASSTWHSTLCVLTWKPKATPHNRLLFQLAVSKHPIEEIESGSSERMWATPQAMDGMRGDQKPRERSQLSEKAKAGGCVNLREQVHQMWPTPRVSDTEGGVVKNVELNNGNFSRTNKKGVRWGVKLKDAVSHVEMLPTPAAHEARLGYQRRDTGKKGSQKSLTTIVIDKQGGRDAVKGSLNPDWVEWLMGYGQGYTDPDNKDSFTLGSHQGFAIEPEIARVTAENQYRKDRLKALGNSIVPQIAYHIGNAILEQEAKNES